MALRQAMLGAKIEITLLAIANNESKLLVAAS